MALSKIRPAASAPPVAAEKTQLVPVVYTMGKVASTSTSTAILNAGLPCYDIHSLEPKYLRKTAQSWLARNEFPPPHICVSMAHRDRLLLKRQRCLYISLVRDPLARNLSAFFQNLHHQKVEIRDEKDAQRMFDTFAETYAHTIPLTWFDREFGGQLGIDVYKRPLDHDRKLIHFTGMNAVIFRIDCPDEVKGSVLTQILGRKISLARDNDSKNKEYHEVYKNVQAIAHFEPDFVDRIYSSKFARHFWTDEERLKMARRWIRPEQQDLFKLTGMS